MRKKRSLKNIIASIVQNLVSILIGIISQAVFIRIFAIEYLGLNSLFGNIITMLSIAELGIGNAITYSLYKPISEKNTELIKSLMKFYKKSYNIIAIIIFIISLIILPFINFFIGDVQININIYIVFMLFVFDTISSYLLSYKRSILYANQENYIINVIHIFYLFLMNSLQLIFLYYTKNYYLYLIIKIIMRILENYFISSVANKKFPFLLEKNTKKLDENIYNDIIKKVKALSLHQIGGFFVNGTDNILISKFFSIKLVGIYSNYSLIIESVKKLFGQVIEALTPSIGNLIVSENKEKVFDIFKKIRFLNFYIAVCTGACIFVLIQDFISLWIGDGFLLDLITLFIIIINYYQTMMRLSYSSFKNSAGIFTEDRFVPIIESFINIIFSILFLNFFGLKGIFIGTFISGLTLWCYSYPHFIYKKFLNGKYINYIFETLGYFMFFIFILIISYYATSFVNSSNIVLQLLIKLIIVIFTSNIMITFIFFNNNNFKYYINMLANYLKKLKYKFVKSI